MVTVALLGTLDTKGAEYGWLADRLQGLGVETLTIDVGSFSDSQAAQISAREVITAAGEDADALRSRKDRGEMMTVMAKGAAAIVTQLATDGKIHAILSVGGSGGSSVAAQAMQALPIGFPKLLVSTMASEVLPVVKKTPVLAGVNGTDPFRVMPYFLKQVKEIGFAGVQNFPTVGLIDGVFRANLEETDMGYGHEVDMIKMANELDLLTSPYVFDVEQAKDMAAAGADILVPHMGLTTSGTIGAKTAMTLEDAAKKVQELADAAKSVNPDILCLCHGGPIANPEDAQYVLDNTDGIVGFYGASSLERFPTEIGIRKQAEDFKALTFKK